MKKLLLLFFVAAIILSLNCGKKEVEIKLSLTNPQDKAVPFNGYYKLTATGDSFPMKDHTPKDYTFILKKDESASGIVYKDTTDMTDTLHFRILQDDEEIKSVKMTSILEAVQFTVTAQ